MIVFGHADLIKKETLNFIKKNYPNINTKQFKLDDHDKIENFIDDLFAAQTPKHERKN